MIYGFNSFGYEGSLVVVESDIREGIPSVDIAGLADSSVFSTWALVNTAIERSGFEIPQKRILIALSPADLRKEEGFSLSIALSLLVEIKNNDVLIMGELENDGNIIPCIKGTFAACQNAKQNGIKYAILPKNSKVPAGIKVYEAGNLKEAADAILSLNTGDDRLFKERNAPADFTTEDNILFNDFPNEEKEAFDKTTGHNNLKFAMAVAIAGRHHLLTYGIPGDGKSCILREVSMLLPKLTSDESNIVSRICSLVGVTTKDYETERPVRIPHPSVTIEGMCGGGAGCRPGIISLAHNGVLILDEAAEFRTSVLQMLRVPLSVGTITLSRAGRCTVFPARFQLFMATSPCPCGNCDSKDRTCLCSKRAIEMYWKKLSYPIDSGIAIKVNADDEDNSRKNFTIKELRNFISTAWKRQLHRQGKLNQDLSIREVSEFIKLTDEAKILFERETEGFSKREAVVILELAQTINDISENFSDELQKIHIEEAIKLHGKIPYVTNI